MTEPENIPPTTSWPPLRSRSARKRRLEEVVRNEAEPSFQQGSSVPFPATVTATLDPVSTLGDITNASQRKYRNGYVEVPKTTCHTPYQLATHGRRRCQPFAPPEGEAMPPPIEPHRGLSESEWQAHALQAKVVPGGKPLRMPQMECANAIVARKDDIVVVAPTGSGKSLSWLLPLLVNSQAVSLVITPYTNLGIEGAERTQALGFSSVFVHSENKSQELLRIIAMGRIRVVFACPEMVESSAFAPIVRSSTFRNLLCGIFVDEAHLIYESASWRIPYSWLGMIRPLLAGVPLIAMSATLPTLYRNALILYTGLKTSYYLINIGNFRPELSTVAVPMKYSVSSFQDLAFLLPVTTALADNIPKTIIYCDNIELLTNMFHWFCHRLHALKLPGSYVNLLHAGLSDEHQERAITDFRKGVSCFLLGTEKIGSGMDFAWVRRVVQYLCRRPLTLPKYKQREGRGGRTAGTTSVGYLMVEAGLLDEDVETEKLDGSVSPDILALIRSKECLDKVFDVYLENPPRSPSSAIASTSFRLCCSNCHPHLQPAQEFRFIMVDPTVTASGAPIIDSQSLSANERAEVLHKLKVWRLESWRIDWRKRWPDFGPTSLISDLDLDNTVKHATKLSSVDDLYAVTQIAFWSELAAPLLLAAKDAVRDVYERREGVSNDVAGTLVQVDSDGQVDNSGSKVAHAVALTMSAEDEPLPKKQRRQRQLAIPKPRSLPQGQYIFALTL